MEEDVLERAKKKMVLEYASMLRSPRSLLATNVSISYPSNGHVTGPS